MGHPQSIPPDEEAAYAGWLQLLDEQVRSFLGIGLAELPPLRLREAYEAGYSPSEVFAGAMYEISLEMDEE
jgi:hypothetical protein